MTIVVHDVHIRADRQASKHAMQGNMAIISLVEQTIAFKHQNAALVD